jgi:GT2 family glycosyltransferase
VQDLTDRFQFKIVSQENGGQSSARNRGVGLANSKFVCMLDQDDYFLPRHIEALLDVADLDDPRFAFSYGDLWRIDESGRVLAHSCVNLESQHPHTTLKALVGTNMYILPSATLIERNAFLDIGGYDVALRGYEDDDLFLRFFLGGYTNRFTSEAVTVWTINTDSTSFSESMARSRFFYFKKLLSHFPEGSVQGVRVFGDLLFKRFSMQFADDVISAAFNEGMAFGERVERLKEFRSILRSSEELAPSIKSRFLFVTTPLVILNAGFIRRFLIIIMNSGMLRLLPGIAGHGEFVRKYLPRKKSLSKSATVFAKHV